MTERAILIECGGETVVGVLHVPQDALADYGIVIVVGGPQYRAGSHRQFVTTARALSKAGHAVLRFDYRGMGDSSAPARSFERVGEDIRAAVDTLMKEVAGVRSVVLYSLCDGASAALMYGPTDTRVNSLVLLNPWVRTDATQAATYLRFYYARRLLQGAFWRKLLTAGINPFAAGGDLLRSVGKSLDLGPSSSSSYVDRMLAALEVFPGAVLFQISGQDLTATEFVQLCRSDKRWHRAVSSDLVTWIDLPDADHTFSTRAHLDAANRSFIDWLRLNGAANAALANGEGSAPPSGRRRPDETTFQPR
jgi:exosortase A-associated hydrolase 1